MASTTDEGDAVPENVSEYELLSGSDESVSFTVLPLEWGEGGTRDGKPQRVFVRGSTDNGQRKIYKQVTAWKFDLSREKPEISVLSAEGQWIKLLKPWRPFHEIIRTIQVTLHLLHFVKWNPQQSQKALWDHLNKNFSLFEIRPGPADLADHLPLINEAVKRDEKLVNSKIMSTFLVEKPWERKNSNEDVKPPLIVDVNEEEDHEDDITDGNGDNGSDEDDSYDPMCAICDNGGDVLICDGKCMRSFHTTIQDDGAFYCESLGLTDEELQAIQNVPFICENCKHKEHQCFACGKLGSSDESSPEVFRCVNGTCGFFFHPDCVAKLLHPGDGAAVVELKQRIVAGEQFACPAHTCHVCMEVEVKSDKELQFAVCRRCPRAYHRKCLPREITTEEDVDHERGILQRAWERLIPNRILIYCLDHEIDAYIYTPVRDHIKFPGPSLERKKKLASESREMKIKLPLKSSMKKNLLNRRGVALEDNAGKRFCAKPLKGVDKVSSSLALGNISKKRVKKFPQHVSSKKLKVATNGISLGKTDAGEISLGEKLYATFYGMDSEHTKSSSGVLVHGESEMSQKVKPTAKRIDSSFTLDADARKRILDLMEDASSSVTLDEVKKKHTAPSTHVQSKFSVTLGKVEGSVQAIRAALKKLDGGCRVQDAKAVCGDDLLLQVLRWKEKLKVYLAPFLYGLRYTSFGRHFTKVDKLKEIVDILHWYVQDGDMLVDFCCGSNDFSCLMKKKLDRMGKSCSFRNYDILQAKNDFKFERRDWMGVKPNELPDGSQLIMGLNPPFGVNAALANKFINKALEFKPKLLILIVPRETHRLDQKESSYDLIWEDYQMFVGKSFYLPGSVDVNDKQIEDWNVNAPVLYLWSRPNWTPKHRAIAEQHRHLSGALKNCRLDQSRNEAHEPSSATECNDLDKSLANQGDLHADEPNNLEQKDKVTTTSDQDVNDSTTSKNHSEFKPKKFGKKGQKKRRSLEDKSSHQCIETLSKFHSERGDHTQFNEGNLPIYQPYSQTGYTNQAYTPSPLPGCNFRASGDRFVGTLEGRANNFAVPNLSYQRMGNPTYPLPGFPSIPCGEMGTPAMQQLAPCLDEMSHARMGNMVYGLPVQDMGANSHPRGPRPAFHGPLGFAPGPYLPYFQRSSSGWLNE